MSLVEKLLYIGSSIASLQSIAVIALTELPNIGIDDNDIQNCILKHLEVFNGISTSVQNDPATFEARKSQMLRTLSMSASGFKLVQHMAEAVQETCTDENRRLVNYWCSLLDNTYELNNGLVQDLIAFKE